MHEPSRDEALMAEVAKGQRAALEALIRRHASPLLTFIVRMIGDFHRGEELFQEVFLAVWCKRHLYQYPRHFKAWLYAIAVNQCRHVFRQTRSSLLPLEKEPLLAVAPDRSPIDCAIATESAGLITAAVALLPMRQRSVVVLRIWQQLSYAEIAQVLDTAEGTVRAYMHHGLNALRESVGSRLGD